MGTGSKVEKNPWKTKAVERSGENKSLRKELVRQKARAGSWREDAFVFRNKCSTQAKEIASMSLIIKDLESSVVSPCRQNVEEEAPLGRYKYKLSLIWLSVNLHKIGLSYRGVCEVLGLLRTFMGLKFPIPSYGTVRIWSQKVGLHLLKNGGKIAISGKKKVETWCLIADESYSLGKSQLLVILAVRLSSLKQGQALRCEDVVPIEIRSQPTWKGEEVATVLKSAIKKIDGKVIYGVADKGASLVNGFQIVGLPHIPDWSHFSSNILEKCYVDNDDFKAFNEKMGAFKKKRKQSQYTDYSPPNLSVKVRFMNYDLFLEWANTMLANFKKIPVEIAPELQFLNELKPFIGEMTDLFKMRQKIGFLLKTEGINSITQSKVMDLLKILEKDMNTKYPNPLKVMAFILGTKQYFALTMPLYEQIHKQNNAQKGTQNTEKGNVAPLFDGLVASSDIIESIFGKLKHRAPKDPKRGFTAFTLIITLFCTDLSISDTAKALKCISVDELEKWEKKNLNIRPYKSFRNVFKTKSKKGKGSKPVV